MKKIFKLIVVSLAICLLPLANSISAIAETESAINVYSTSSGLIAPASVIMEYDDGDDLSPFTKTVSSKMVRPATMIVEVDENFTVLCGGERIDYDIFRTTYIKSKMIPAVRVETEGAADALIDYLSTRGYDFIDFSVVSTSPALVKKVRDDRKSIRGVIDYTKTDVSNMSAGQIANQMSVNKSIIGIFDQNQVDAKKVFELQGRFKSVWLKSNIDSAHDVYACIASGAVGFVTDNYATVYETYLSIEGKTLSRGFYGIGHRGLPSVAGENTLEGMIAAYESGATHVELDTKVCKSGEIVIMHDDGLSSTTDGTGNVLQMTLSEIRKYKVVKNSNGQAVTPCEIPTLEDVFKYFKGKDVVLVVETKNAQSHYPALLGKLIEKYDIADQVVAIGFGLTELGLVRDQVPNIPTANLNGTTKSDFLVYMAQVNALNTTPNPSKSTFMSDTWVFKNSLARGYLPYCWTFSSTGDTEGAVARGIVGITTDRVDYLGKYVEKIDETSLALTQSEFSGTFEIGVITYKGITETRVAKVLSYEETGENTYSAIIVYQDNSYNRLTEELSVAVALDAEESSSSQESQSESAGQNLHESTLQSDVNEQSDGGCGGSIAGAEIGCILIVAATFVIRQKVKKS
ncbi:MAG: hypothetical protein IJY84_02100 [Clostridia bacterium]|nr:hypothetical protein [Clostridia bacterium]